MKRLNQFIIILMSITALTGCSVYRNSPTPDDVYYAPGAPVEETAASPRNNGTGYYSTPNDNYVKMRVQDPNRWSYFDDYNYDYYGGYSPYGYSSSFGISMSFGTGYYSPWYGGFGYYSPMSYYNSYYAWNNFYNPYYHSVIVVNGKNYNTPSYTRMSNFNPSAYHGNYYNTRPVNTSHYTSPYSSNVRNTPSYYNTHSNSNFNRSTNNRPTYSSPAMHSSPSNFSSGGGGGGGGGRSGGFSRPGR